MDYDPTFLVRPVFPDLTPDAQGRVALRPVNVATRLQQPDPQNPGAVHPAHAREDRDRDRIRGDLVQTD